MSLGKRLLTWPRRAAVTPAEPPEPDYLPDLPDVGRLRTIAGGADGGVGPGEFAAVLLRVARDGDHGLRTAAIDILGAASARWWLVFDEALRERWWWAPRWSRSIEAELADGEVGLLSLVLAGCHHNGRIREAAVARLGGQPHPAAVAVLALRACDWVAEVRVQACTALETRLSTADGSELAQLAGLAFMLRDRRTGAWLVERIEAILKALPPDRLAPLLSARDRQTRRAAYRAAIAANQLSLARLTAAAVKDDDLPVRTMCARAAVTRAADPTDVRGLLASRTALVRAEALHALTRTGDVDVAVAALPDRHPVVRAVAQDALRRAGTDPAVLYRRLVEVAEPAPGAIAGLGETGGPADAGRLARNLSQPRTRVRVAAVRALRRIGSVDAAGLVPLLRDDSGAVTRQVVATLRHHAGILDPVLLDDLLSPDNLAHVRFAGYRLSTQRGAWLRLATNLRLVDDTDERLRVSARADIGVWLNGQAATTYHAPSRDRVAELEILIERARPILGDTKVRLLRFHAGLAP